MFLMSFVSSFTCYFVIMCDKILDADWRKLAKVDGENLMNLLNVLDILKFLRSSSNFLRCLL